MNEEKSKSILIEVIDKEVKSDFPILIRIHSSAKYDQSKKKRFLLKEFSFNQWINKDILLNFE